MNLETSAYNPPWLSFGGSNVPEPDFIVQEERRIISLKDYVGSDRSSTFGESYRDEQRKAKST